MSLDIDAFERSESSGRPPDGLAPELRSLWHAGRAEWDRAHEIVQALDGPAAAWVHAHLHRVEGDLANAAYWYRRAGRRVPTDALRDEWRAIVVELLTTKG